MALSKVIRSLFSRPANKTHAKKRTPLQHYVQELESRLVPANATWNGTTNAAWATGTNWSAATPTAGETATFNNAGNSNTTIDLGAGVTIGTVLFDTVNAAAYTIGSGGVGAQTLTFSNTGAATVNAAVANNQLVNANVVLGTTGAAGTTTLTNNSLTSTLTFAGTTMQGGAGSGGAKTLAVAGAGNITIASAIANGGATSISLTKSGAGVLTLSGPNTYTGNTRINVQNNTVPTTIRTAANDVLPDSSLLEFFGGTLDLNGNSDTVNGPSGTAIYYSASGTFGLINVLSTGAGTLTIGGNIGIDSDTHTAANIISGNLNLGSATRTVTNATLGGGINASNQFAPLQISANVTGSGAAGITTAFPNGRSLANALILSGNNSYPGTTTIGNGWLVADHVNALGSGGNITFAGGNGTLRYTANSAASDYATRFKNNTAQPIRLETNAQTITFAGAIDNTNTQGLVKLDAGTLILQGNNAYTGATTVNEGTLRLDKSTGNIVATSALTLGGGTFTLRGASSGSSAQTLGNLTINAGNDRIVIDSNGGDGTTLTLGNTWGRSAGGTLGIDLSASNTAITSTGGLAAGTQTSTQAILGYATVTDAAGTGFAANVAGSIVRYTGAATLAAGSTGATTNFQSAPSGTSTSGSPYLTLTPALNPSFNSLSLDTSSATGANFLDLAGNIVTLTQLGLLMTGSNDLTIQNGQIGATNSEVVLHQFGTGTLTINSLIGGGSGSLAKAGSGTVVLNGPNFYSGTTTVAGGVLNIRDASALGTIGAGTTVSLGAALEIQGNIETLLEPLTINGSGVSNSGSLRNISGYNIVNGAVTLGAAGARINSDAGTLVINNTISGPALDLAVGGAGNTTIVGAINTFGGSITKDGSGTLALQGANAFTGNLNINNGIVTALAGQTVGGNQTGPFGRGNTITFGGGTLQYSPANQFDYSGRFSAASNQAIKIDTNGQNVTFATNLTSSGGSLTKSGFGTLTISGTANTYTGGTTVNGGTLLLSGVGDMPATGAVTVNSGATFSLADGTARTTTDAASLTLADGATLVFDWNAGAQDTLTSAAAVTASGRIGIMINNISPTGAGGVLLSSPNGGLTSGGASYYLINNANFTATLTVTDTQISIGAQTSGTALVNNAFWYGNTVAAANTVGLDNVMSISTGAVSNWSTTSGAYTATGLVPGSTANVVFSATGATQQSNVVPGANMTLNTLTFNDPTAVTIAGSNALTLMSTGTGASSAVSTNQNATINSGLMLGANQTWTTAATKTLTVGGSVAGNFGLTIAGAGTASISGTLGYSGATTVNNGSTLTFASGSNKAYQGTGNTLVVTGAVNVASNVDIEHFGGSGLNGVLNVTGGGVLTIRNAATNQDQNAGIGHGGYGMLNIAGGTVNVLTSNNGGPGSMNMQNGGSQGLLRITGGSLNAGTMMIARNGGGTSELTITGGAYNKPGGSLNLGDRGSFVTHLNVAGGLIDNSGQTMTWGRAGGTPGSSLIVANFDAGTILTREFAVANQAGFQVIANYNGGTIKLAPGVNANFYNGTQGANSSFQSYVNGPFGAFNGGLVVDTNGSNTAMNSPLLAPTGDGVTAIAVATGGSGYTGAPIVAISNTGTTQSGTANGTTTITMADTTGVFVGQRISGTGIGAGSIVTAVTANTSIVISQTAAAGTNNYTFVGQGATAYANVSGGAVTDIVVTNPGVGYVGTVTATFAGGFGTGGCGTAATIGTITTAANTSGGVTKNGSGTLTLSGTNTFTGTNVVNAGVLAFGQTGANAYNAISGAGAVSQTGTGTTTLNGNNTYTGVTTISSGVLLLNHANALPGGIGATGGTGALTFNGGVLGLGVGDYSRPLGAAGVVDSANFTGAGGWAAYNADRAVNLGGASVQVVWATANTGLNGQTLILGNATSTHTVDVQNPFDLGNAARTVQADNGSASVDGKLSAVLSGTGGSITKTGAGTLEISANNTYTGTTLINAGTLIFSGNNSAQVSNTTIALGGIAQFNSLNSIPNTGRSVTDNGAVSFGPGFGAGNIPDGLLRLATASTGAVAIDNYASTNFDFNAAGLTAASLGSIGNLTYTGTLTPQGGTYRLGGAGGTITMGNTNALTGANAVTISGNVVIAAANDNTGATTVNANSTLTLGTGITGQNGSVGGGSIILSAATSTLVFNNFEDIIYTGVISGSGSIIKNGPGKVTFTAAQTFTGTTTVNAGTLTLGAGDHTLAANKNLVVNSGGTLDLGANKQYVGQFSGTGGSVIGSGTLTTNPTGAATFAGAVGGTANLTKVAGQTLTLTGDSTTTGTIKLIGGVLTLIDAGVLSGSSGGITINGSTFTINNTGAAGNNNRVNDNKTITVNAGFITFNGRAATNSTETLGAVTANTGSLVLTSLIGTGGSAELTMTSLNRTAGATLFFNQGMTNFGTAGNSSRILANATNSPLTGNLAPINNVVPGAFYMQNTDNYHFVNYSPTLGFTIMSTYTNNFAAATATSNVSDSATNSVTANKTVNSFRQGNITFTNGSPTGGTDLLTIGSGMTILASNTWGSTTQRGRITSGTNELFLFKRDANVTPDPIVHSVIVDKNGSTAVDPADKVSLVIHSQRQDRGYYVHLTAPNLYSGGTFVDVGPLNVNSAGLSLDATSAGIVTIPAGGLTLNDKTLVDMTGFAGQIDPTNVVTINGGGQLNLMGTNTLAGIDFNSNGGTLQPKVTPRTTITANSNNNLASYSGNAGTLIITGNITSTPTNLAVVPLFELGFLDFNGSASHDVTVSPLPDGNFVAGVGPLNGLQISSVIQNGGFTLKGGGVLNLTGSNTFAGQLTIEDGVLNVASVNNVSANGVFGNSALAVIMGGTGGKTGTLEYTGGNASSTKPFTLATGGSGAFQIDTAATNLNLSGLVDGLGGLVKTGSGTLTLSNGANSYTGGTIVNAGTLTATGATPLGSIGGTLAVNNPNTGVGTAVVLNLPTTVGTTTGSLSGAIATPAGGTNTATINNGGQLFTVNQTTAGVFAGAIAGNGGFRLGDLSVNKLTLSGVNTYIGATDVNGGTLLVNGSLAAASTVTVASLTNGATATLGGTGVINGSVNLNATASVDRVNRITGGDIGTIGTLSTGNLTFDNGAIGYFDITSAVTKDLLAVTGNLAVTSGTANIAVPTGLAEGSYTLITYTGSAPSASSFTLTNFAGAAILPASGYSITVSGGELKLVVVNPFPTVTSVTPFVGPTSGGNYVVIVGSGFGGATVVNFGVNAGTSITESGGTQITVIAPSGSGLIDVTVTTPGGTSATAGTGNDYTYAVPAITSVVVNGGPIVARDAANNIPTLLGQNSIVSQILVTFNQQVTLDANAFDIDSLSGSFVSASGAVPSPTDVAVVATGVSGTGNMTDGYTQYVLTFTGPGTTTFDNSLTGNGGSGNVFTTINSGFFQLNAVGSKIHAESDTAADSSEKFWALFGANNPGNVFVSTPLGNGQTNLQINSLALGDIYAAFGSISGTPQYKDAYDSNLDGQINVLDLTSIYANFGTVWQF